MINKKVKEFGEDTYNVRYAARLENGKIFVKVITETPNVLFEYHLYSGSILIEKIKYTPRNLINFSLKDFGSYRIKIFVKGNKEAKSGYSFFTEFLKFNEISAIKSLKIDKENADEPLNNISSIILEKYKTEQKINAIIEKLYAIQNLNYNVIKYFKDQNIKHISLYGYKDEVILSKLLWLNSRFENDFKIKYLLTSTPFAYEITVPRKIELKFQKLDKTKEFDKNDVIVICSSQKNEEEIAQIQSISKANVIHITELIGKLFISQYIEQPLKDLKAKNPDVSFVVCTPPDIAKIKNKSTNEQEIIKNNISLKSIRDNMFNKSEIPAALRRFSSDVEYVKQVMGTYYLTEKDDIIFANDFESKFVNVVNNFRLTTDQPTNYKNTIYIFGNSITFGLGSNDEDTIASILQRIINTNGTKYKVVNCSNHVSSDYDYQFKLMNKISLKPNDIVISVMSMNIGESDDYIIDRTQSLFNRPHDHGEIFIDRAHINKVGNEIIANSLYNTMKKNKLFTKKAKKEQEIELPIMKESKPKYEGINQNELDAFLSELKKKKTKTKGEIGAVVMNCNPFTLGHRYLIEYASKQVDHLYVFVVEEDKSFFPFKDRFKLVQEGTKDIKNVTVLPSGKFIISSLTFSDYFNKEKVENKTINMSEDVEIFGNEIAPTLNITKRFVGDEPLCPVTKQYNNTLMELLPKYGVELIVLDRKNKNNKPISATTVRNYLKEKNFEEIKKLVPKTTYDYLKKFEIK